jgi:hypothetical protein
MKETNKNEEIQKEMVEDKLPIQQHQNQFGGTVERNENIEVQNQIKVNNSEKNGTQSERRTPPKKIPKISWGSNLPQIKNLYYHKQGRLSRLTSRMKGTPIPRTEKIQFTRCCGIKL